MKTSNKPEPSPEQKLNRFFISEHDFTQAEEFLSAFNKELSFPIQRALLNSAVIAYARPFSKNELSATAKASSRVPGELTKTLSRDQKVLHDRLIELRKKAIAHSESSHNPVQIFNMGQHSVMSQSRFFDILHERLNISDLKALTEHMQVHCMTQGIAISRCLNQKNKINRRIADFRKKNSPPQ